MEVKWAKFVSYLGIKELAFRFYSVLLLASLVSS